MGSCHSSSQKTDYLFWGSLVGVLFFYCQGPWVETWKLLPDSYIILSQTVFSLMNTMWLSLLVGILMIGLLSKVPREFVVSILGTDKGVTGLLRAMGAGVLLDLCNHGILMVGAKLYERGASIGQVVAFLVASPWNSFSLTLILIALIGITWTLLFIALSALIAVMTGFLFNLLVKKGKLPDNPHAKALPEGFRFWASAKIQLRHTEFNGMFFRSLVLSGIQDSRMVMRWILFGVLLAGLVRAFVPTDIFGSYFGPTLAGLGLTVLVATVLEVCSEGSTPLAADLLTRAGAPGNSFAFLMTGVSTDYTEMVVLKDTTRSWRVALLLPLLSLPQVLVIAWLMNSITL